MTNKITQEQANFILNKSKEDIIKFPYLRLGQQFFNNLYWYHEDVAELIRGTQYDTFYRDDKINECIKFITT